MIIIIKHALVGDLAVSGYSSRKQCRRAGFDYEECMWDRNSYSAKHCLRIGALEMWKPCAKHLLRKDCYECACLGLTESGFRPFAWRSTSIGEQRKNCSLDAEDWWR